MLSMRFTADHSLSTGAPYFLRALTLTIRGAFWSASHAACNGRIIYGPIVECVIVGPMEAMEGRGEVLGSHEGERERE